MSSQFVNTEEGLGRVRNNKQLYVKMLGMFQRSTEFEQLEQCIKQCAIWSIPLSRN